MRTFDGRPGHGEAAHRIGLADRLRLPSEPLPAAGRLPAESTPKTRPGVRLTVPVLRSNVDAPRPRARGQR
jgi:hypothetical protein